ncbi:MAG: hypothetical protein J6J36_00755 [Clostridia bacterium]|nr:hypothetical protein [Clostridia bacterium]
MEKINLFEELKRKINFGEKVSAKEYLYLLAVSQLPQMSHLQTAEGDVFTDETLWECKRSQKTASEEGYKQALEQFEEFKNKDVELLTEQAAKDYENKKLNYDRKLEEIKYQKELIAETRAVLGKFENYPDFVKMVTEILEKIEEKIVAAEEMLQEPIKETVTEYKERVTKAYETGLKEYKEVLEKEKDYTIEGINQFVKEFMGVLNAVGEEK